MGKLNGNIELVHRQLATFEALRRLGFTPDEIQSEFYGEGSQVMTVLKSQGKEFRIEFFDTDGKTRLLPTSRDEYQKAWTAESDRWKKDMPEAEMQRIYRKHYTVDILTALALSLREKGLLIPAFED